MAIFYASFNILSQKTDDDYSDEDKKNKTNKPKSSWTEKLSLGGNFSVSF